MRDTEFGQNVMIIFPRTVEGQDEGKQKGKKKDMPMVDVEVEGEEVDWRGD